LKKCILRGRVIFVYLDSFQARLASHKGVILQIVTGEELRPLFGWTLLPSVPATCPNAFQGREPVEGWIGRLSPYSVLHEESCNMTKTTSSSVYN
jgi:hypothetical protein